MKFFTNKKLVSITAAVLLLAVAVGTTLAFVFTNTNPVENTFNPSKVACAVVENNSTTETGDIVYTGNIKTNVQIKNTGDTDAYIRVAVVINWKSADGTRVWAIAPEEDDYTITYDLSKGWFLSSDGYYYYNKPVSSVDDNNLTPILISEAKLNDGVTPPTGTDGTQYYLSIEIVASAIQASGIDDSYTAQEAWAKAAETDSSSGN